MKQCVLAMARQFITSTADASLCLGHVMRTGDRSISSTVAVAGESPWASMIVLRAFAGTRYREGAQVVGRVWLVTSWT